MIRYEGEFDGWHHGIYQCHLVLHHDGDCGPTPNRDPVDPPDVPHDGVSAYTGASWFGMHGDMQPGRRDGLIIGHSHVPARPPWWRRLYWWFRPSRRPVYQIGAACTMLPYNDGPTEWKHR